MNYFVIGASAGGVEALKSILPGFDQQTGCALIVVHIPAKGPNLLPKILQDVCSWKIKEAESSEPIRSGTIYIAPSDYHLNLEPDSTLSLSSEDPVNFSRPSIDLLMESAATSFRENVIGILLSGANHDGAQGLKKIHDCGGITIVQDPTEAEYSTMPAASLALFQPTHVLSLSGIRNFISKVKHHDQL
jgi:two-component system, chemotaxis family, protein-glutamate methylesterase/glutaminase